MASDSPSSPEGRAPLSATDYHVLLVLAGRDLYGYAIMQAVEEESRGAVSPEIGSLYRVLARLMADGLIDEVEAPSGDEDSEGHRGRPRRYYGLTELGRVTLREEIRRLKEALALAEERDLLPGRGAL